MLSPFARASLFPHGIACCVSSHESNIYPPSTIPRLPPTCAWHPTLRNGWRSLETKGGLLLVFTFGFTFCRKRKWRGCSVRSTLSTHRILLFACPLPISMSNAVFLSAQAIPLAFKSETSGHLTLPSCAMQHAFGFTFCCKRESGEDVLYAAL